MGSMSRRTGLASAAVGLLVFLVVGLVTTELLVDVVWPSLFVGIPVGALAGLTAGLFTWYVLEER